MDRVAVFVDAGYLFAAGSIAISGEKLPRGRLALNYASVVRSLELVAAKMTSLPLLRIYWYDGTSTGPTPQHLALGYRNGIKVRLGFVNSQGAQKGVDSLIVTDMIDLARNRAMTDAVLLSGDEDIRVGVQLAQTFGVKVHLIGIEPSRKNQSGFLVQEADSTLEWSRSDLESFLSVIPIAEETIAHAAIADVSRGVPITVIPSTEHTQASEPRALAVFTQVAEEVASSMARPEIFALVQAASASQVPKDVDRRLLVRASALLGSQLDGSQKRALRARFFAECSRILNLPIVGDAS